MNYNVADSALQLICFIPVPKYQQITEQVSTCWRLREKPPDTEDLHVVRAGDVFYNYHSHKTLQIPIFSALLPSSGKLVQFYSVKKVTLVTAGAEPQDILLNHSKWSNLPFSWVPLQVRKQCRVPFRFLALACRNQQEHHLFCNTRGEKVSFQPKFQLFY